MNAHTTALYVGLQMHPTMAKARGLSTKVPISAEAQENRRRTEQTPGATRKSAPTRN